MQIEKPNHELPRTQNQLFFSKQLLLKNFEERAVRKTDCCLRTDLNLKLSYESALEFASHCKSH
jgi:hypothetical protein